MSQIAYIKLSQLHLWTENPRTGSVEDEIDEIITLINKQQTKKGNKLISLATSIVQNGLFEPIGILKYSDGFMVVKEGNRRVTCLKLLKNPEIIPAEFLELKKAFQKLKKSFNPNITVAARIFNENENDDLEKWIELRHNGLQEGKGLDTWGSMEKVNWNKYRGRNTPLLDFHNYLILRNILNREQINSVSKTNWERILGIRGRVHLGLDYVDKKFIIRISEPEFKDRIIKTVQNLNGKSVGAVYDNESIDAFFTSLNFENIDSSNNMNSGITFLNNNENYSSRTENNLNDNNSKNEGENPSNKPQLGSSGKQYPHQEGKSDDGDNNEGDVNLEKDMKKARREANPAPFLCNLLCYLESSQDTDGIIKISTELKKMSKNKAYLDYPIGAAVLMRMLLEQCLIYYLKKRNKWDKFRNSKKNEPTLTEIIEKYRNDTDIFAHDKKIQRLLVILIESIGLKEHFNMIVHHPEHFAATPDILDSIAQNGYLALIQYIIEYR